MQRGAVVLVLLALGCGPSASWQRTRGYHPVVPLVFSDQTFVGQGVIRTPDGFVTRGCLESLSTVTRGGTLEVELLDPDDPAALADARLRPFVEEASAAAARLAGQGPPPVSLIIAVRSPGQWVDALETSARFRPSIQKLVARGDEKGFFKQCGTEVVVSARYDAAAYVFVSYLPATGEQARAVEKLVVEGMARSSGDVLQLALLDQLPPMPALYAVRMDADDLVMPAALSLEATPGAGVRALVNDLVTAVLDVGRGHLERFVTRPWRTFGDARLLVPPRARDPRPQEQKEFVTARLEVLERSVQRYWLRLFQSEYFVRHERSKPAFDCAGSLTFLRRDLGPQELDACEAQARKRQIAAVELLPRCQRLLRALERATRSPSCRTVALMAADIDAPLLHDATYLPVELTLDEQERWLDAQDRMEPPYAAEFERGRMPDAVPLGTGMDRNGRRHQGSCIRAEDEPVGPVDDEATSEEERQLAKAAAGGAKAGPPPPRFDQDDWDEVDVGPVPDEPADAPVAAPSLPPGVEAGLATVMPPPGDDDAHEGAGPAPIPDSSRKPVERVTRLMSEQSPWGRRAWSWWHRALRFWKNPPEDRLIYRGVVEVAGLTRELSADFELTDAAQELARRDLEQFYEACGTHYVAQVEHRRGFVYYFAPTSPDQREITVLPYGVSETARLSPVWRPPTVRAFLRQKSAAVDLLREDTDAVPVRLRLEPWINYLRTHGYVTR